MPGVPSEETIDKMENLLNIASDSTRLKILYAISDTEKSVSEIVDLVGASQSLVSHQLQVLRLAHLVSTRKDGTHVFYALDDDHVNRLLTLVYEHVNEEK
jgi:ArsR family transcriptional regulator, lead/cadmium/zinc/bismuth-responsive transcriptional repressor